MNTNRPGASPIPDPQSPFPNPNLQPDRSDRSDRSDQSDQSAFPNPQSAFPNPQSAIRNPQSAIHCPPKVNLYLRIVRRREDGFHELETVFQSVGGGDTLAATPAGTLTLTTTDPDLPVDERNLVMKAALLLRERYPRAAGRGAALTLVKRTPSGAGMGGGSVDAAAALVLLAHLWELEVPSAELAALAAELGSDVPFFLQGGTALARGRGEILTPLPTAPLWLALLRPPVGVSTSWAYRQWRPEAAAGERAGGPSVEEFAAALRAGDPAGVAAALRNDLEPGVAAGVPEIAAAREWLLAQGVLGARMTGSGSVVLGIARDEEHAREIAARPGAPGLLWAAPCLTAEEARLAPVEVSGKW
jgi:4-diphosphocytidyl-2-C-methyl-D-erythritol kinase